jgi:hypothetical protein
MNIKMRMMDHGFYFGPDGDGDWEENIVVHFSEIEENSMRVSDHLAIKYIRLAERMKLNYYF